MSDVNPEDEVEANVLSVIAHVIGFDQQDPTAPPVPSDSAREADLLMMNWIVSNQTDEDIIWTFASRQYYKLQLLRLNGDETEVLWELEFEEPPEGGDEPAGGHEPTEPEEEEYTVTVPKDGIYSVPPSEDDDEAAGSPTEEVDELPPMVPLQKIVADQSIPDADELAVKFQWLANEFPQTSIIPLWR